MSFPAESFSKVPRATTADLHSLVSEYPDTLSSSARAKISVPLPREHDPEWTSAVPGFSIGLPSFPDLIRLPDPLSHPALYAAAADTIRITNWRFKEHGPYKQKLLQAHVKKHATEWRIAFPDKIKYPFPPDLRTLYVKTKDEHPAVGQHAVWTQACGEFGRMSDNEKQKFLHTTRQQHINENELDGLDRDDKLYRRIFKRFLVWQEHVDTQNNRKDQQPSRKEMLEFFAKDEMRKNGATLSDICQAFPNAKDIEMLVYRIEGLAVYTFKPNDKEEPVESVYRLKPAPTADEIKRKVTKALFHGPLSFHEILEKLYPFGFGHEEAIAKGIKNIAKPTVTGQEYGLISTSAPTPKQIHTIMSDINGYTFGHLVQLLSDQLSQEAALLVPLSQAAYQDSNRLWYRRFIVDEKFVLDDEANRRLRTQSRLEAMEKRHPAALALLLDDVADWDSTAGLFVKKTVRLGPVGVNAGVETTPISPPSPTEVGSPPPSPRQYVTETARLGPIRVNAGVETTPVSPPSPTEVGSSPPIRTIPGNNKRKRSEEDVSGKPLKKTKSQPAADDRTRLVQCSGRTQQDRRCKIKQRRPTDQTWFCGRHDGQMV